ncbi:flagellar type III secretion system protein FliR [Helicobacter cholecystus]|uniref:Flagellar biosynthetic protein FliR n=1 Tax=Helicobacter cholecystus TaxID=45498 RepID=A0A3D8IU45_9HELI|nr:flagellar biosynthetic protein FliR [Helicobacter cholecystus]RDU68164.1 flagellar type III secretion system protein FliR [Helicobacter cholecystus]VEJ24504.1 flagellar biosynthesis protein [Helicobacter cholecystus]
MEWIAYITQNNIAGFLLLLLRFGGLFAFFPFFENQLVPVSVRATLTFFCTFLFFPLLPSMNYNLSLVEFVISGVMEIMLGFISGLVLNFVFSAITFGGDLMSFSMGLTMASAYDPVSGAQKPIIAQTIAMLALVLVLTLDFHHGLFLLVAESFTHLPLGTFALSNEIVEYCVNAFITMIVIGFSMAFPIVAILLLADIIFGMIMKTNPQFNLLAIGFPIKIAIGFLVISVVISAVIYHFENTLISAFEFLKVIFWSK